MVLKPSPRSGFDKATATLMSKQSVQCRLMIFITRENHKTLTRVVNSGVGRGGQGSGKGAQNQ
jgi:hypothetical protein